MSQTFFAEGLGNPAVEYMFCTAAARVAQAKGLHRRPAKAWNLAAHDELHYSWLFWAIYCCEKHIAHRSGRPSVSHELLIFDSAAGLFCVLTSAFSRPSTMTR